MRVGIGFDAHRFEQGRSLILGGVHIEGAVGLGGHSDADVVSHAIADALLGAARLGDLGRMFPSDDRWRDASSIDLLRETEALLHRGGWRVGNVDATVVAELPRLAPFVQQMSRNISAALGVEHADVSIKATTTDGLGFAGRGEGIAAMATALVLRVTE